METYLLNSAGCLAILLLFYKLLLEKETMHQFKRFYLLGSLFASMLIPLITFTTYLEVIPQSLQQISNPSVLISEGTTTSAINWSGILWMIYGLGVLVFSIKFIRNLIALILKIKHNLKLKKKDFTNVLLEEKIIPHTFFSFLFFNKDAFLKKQIPTEVIIHEEAHAQQLHSLDVLIVELLQIVFWFNPLIYLTKYAIKLNHEFLADQSVICKGVETSLYQKTLLAFSSNAEANNLANAFNYSSIKKRFTVMKTETSNRAIWGKGILLLPLLAILFYGFSDKIIVVKESIDFQPLTQYQDTIPNKKLKVHIDEETIIMNGKITDLKDFVKTMNEITSDWIKEDFDLYGLEIKVGDNVENSFIEKINAEYAKTNLAKKSVSNSPFITRSRNVSPNLANAPSSPPKIEDYLTNDSNIYLEGKIISAEEAIELMNTKGKELTVSIRENGKIKPIITMEFKDAVPPPPPPFPAPEHGLAIPPHPANGMVAPPPPPPVPAVHMKELSERGGVFYYEGKQITGKEAIEIAKSYKSINIQVKDHDSKKPIVKLSKDPIIVEDR